MNILLAIAVALYATPSLASSMIDLWEIPQTKISYEIDVPAPFGLTRIDIVYDGSVDQYIEVVKVIYDGETYQIGKDQLQFGFSAGLGENVFYYRKRDIKNGNLTEFDFTLFYGAPIKVECGIDSFEYVKPHKRIVVRPHSELQVTDANWYIKSCEKYTKAEKRNGEKH
tara:strand:- start:1708 stop:2214 length:507 start_codon:yes stop_codon:yes gene_type:complete